MPRHVVGKCPENAARRARAIHAAIRVRQIGVVGEVEALRAELQFHLLGDGHRLEERHVPLRERRAHDLVAAHRAELGALRTLPRAIHLAVGGERRAGGLEPPELAGVVHLVVADQIGPAPSRVAVRAAIAVARRERLAGHPGVGAVHLPSSQDKVHGFRGAAHVLASLAERHFIERSEEEHMRPVVVGHAARQTGVARIVSAVVVDIL